MFKFILKTLVIVAVLAGLVYFVGVIWFSDDPTSLDIPTQEDAAYSLRIENTGELVLADDYEMHGTQLGSRVFILHGFWELRGQSFVYVDGDIVYDEAIFGKITLVKRSR